jgi:16S rRNA (uracil1498-N3)-methyltransferase
VDRTDTNGGARAFFLAATEEQGGPELYPEDAAHARRVLRLKPGDELTGLDGCGGRWPLRVASIEGGQLAVESAGAGTRDPAPGASGAPLPWIEVAVAVPKEKRAESMLDRLVQLGAAALTPLSAERAQAHQRELSAGRRRRFERIAREACKQCGRTWLPEIHAATTPEELLAARPEAALVLLDPRSGRSLLEWARELGPETGTRARPILLVIGPEGGLTEAERERLLGAGACPVRIAPHVLRIETAAEAALAGLVQSVFDPD